jgi:hypothetical protein
MSVFAGYAGSRYQHVGRIEVSIELLLGYVMIRGSTGEWLDGMPAVNVSATKLDESLVKLSFDDDELQFECAQLALFLKELETESAYFQSISGWRRSSRRARMSLARFEKAPESQASGGGGHAKTRTRPEQPNRHLADKDLEIVHPGDEDSLHAKFSSAQEDVVESIATAMSAWFGYYFRLGEGTPHDRLVDASRGLEDGADGLRLVGGFLEDLTSAYDDNDKLLRTYQAAVSGWADAFEKISAGTRFDQRSLARAGFARMNEASVIAEAVIVPRSTLAQHLSLSRHLATLRQFRPPERAPNKTAEKAKTPWSRALTAAGSPLDWNDR